MADYNNSAFIVFEQILKNTYPAQENLQKYNEQPKNRSLHYAFKNLNPRLWKFQQLLASER